MAQFYNMYKDNSVYLEFTLSKIKHNSRYHKIDEEKKRGKEK